MYVIGSLFPITSSTIAYPSRRPAVHARQTWKTRGTLPTPIRFSSCVRCSIVGSTRNFSTESERVNASRRGASDWLGALESLELAPPATAVSIQSSSAATFIGSEPPADAEAHTLGQAFV